MNAYVLSLADPNATLETVGGKGMSLAKMARAGLPVPGGFHVTTEAYRCFVDANGIQPRILAALAELGDPEKAAPERLEAASQQIGRCFTGGNIPPEIAAPVRAAYAALPGRAAAPAAAAASAAAAATATEAAANAVVAVRSSATAEDLPGASFAGQQETYLNISGQEAVLDAVKKCWASLWTARAIAYRARQGIDPEDVALAVVVQQLVFADAAGVLFTADPVSGRRSEMLITATWGLGEALVGGLVTPDTLAVEKSSGRVIRRETGQKQVMTVRDAAGTREEPVPERLQKAPVLSSAQAAGLAKWGREIEQLYGMPMDIEWTMTKGQPTKGQKFEGQFQIVQARPITNLPEPPLVWNRSNPKAMLARSSFAEFVPDPVSPLFATLAIPIAREESDKLMQEFLNAPDRDVYVFDIVNGYVYIGFVMTAEMTWKMMTMAVGQSAKMMKASRARWTVVSAKYRDLLQQWQRDLSTLSAVELLAGAREIFRAVAEYYTVGQSGPIAGAPFSETVFNAFYKPLVKGKQDPDHSIFLLGFDTLPLKAEKSLYDLAQWVKTHPGLAEAIQGMPTGDLCAALKAETIAAPEKVEFVKRFIAHLSAYGHTLYDLDFAKPVPADDPTPVIEGLKAYLAGQGVGPYERQRAQVERREQAEQAILKRLDPLRRKGFTKLLKWAQACGPDRENCIADLGLGYPRLRKLLGELGRRLAAGGAIALPADIYWLEAAEVDALAAALDAGQPLTAHMDAVERRKAAWQRARATNPPVTLPEKSWMSKLVAHDNPRGSVLKGYGASAGKVTAPACVLRGPDDFGKMRPGDVIVAVTTTPAWTPLFTMAAAVVTDIGGPLSHSSIVAREYGIPAVMATGSASRRIQSGQLITVDGTAGVVTIENGDK